jgi:hypothetical protein
VGVQLVVSGTEGVDSGPGDVRRLVWDDDGRLASPFLAAIGARPCRACRTTGELGDRGSRFFSDSPRTSPAIARPGTAGNPRYRTFRQCRSGTLSSPAGPERRRSARYTRRRRSAAATHPAPSMERMREAAQGGATAPGACHRAGGRCYRACLVSLRILGHRSMLRAAVDSSTQSAESCRLLRILARGRWEDRRALRRRSRRVFGARARRRGRSYVERHPGYSGARCARKNDAIRRWASWAEGSW